MLERHSLPPAEASWSRRVVEAEPDLREGKTLVLARAIEIALKYHPDGVAGRSIAEAASARTGEVLSAYLPQVGANASWSRASENKRLDRGKSASSEERRVDANAKQLVFDVGAAAAVREAGHQAQAAAFDWEVTRQGLAFGVREAYFKVLENQALLETAEDSLESFQRHLDKARKLHEVGQRTRFDVTKAEVDVSNARIERIKVANALNLSRAGLNKALGLEEDPGYRLQQEVPFQRFAVSFEDAVDQARKSRPDLGAARARLEGAVQSVKKAWAGYLPTLSLTGSYGASGSRFPLVWNWSGGPGLDWNWLNGFQTTRQVDQAEAIVRRSRADLASAEQKAYLELRQAWLNLQEAAERLPLADETVRYSQESHTLAQARYRAGQGTQLDLTDAQVALTRAQGERVRSRADYEIGVAAMLKAMGLLNQGGGP